MKEVKIICGTYGYRPDGAKRPKPVKYGGVVTVPDEEAERLVKLGGGKSCLSSRSIRWMRRFPMLQRPPVASPTLA